MDTKQLKKETQNLIKKYSLELIHIDGLKCKFKGSGFQSLIFMNKKTELGWLQYSYVTNRMSKIGSVFGFYISTGFRINNFSTDDVPDQFKLLKLLTKMNLSYSNVCISSKCYHGLNSLNTLRKNFYDDGHVSIFENDELPEKLKNAVTFVNTIYVSRIIRFLRGDIELLDDIFEKPNNFGYPLATALAVCKLNNKEDLFGNILEKGKKITLMEKEIQFLDEIQNKLNEE